MEKMEILIDRNLREERTKRYKEETYKREREIGKEEIRWKNKENKGGKYKNRAKDNGRWEIIIKKEY